MPVDEPSARPLRPVNPRSNTRGTSSAGIPGPSSATSKTVRASAVPSPSVRAENRTVDAPCFAAFVTSCPTMNASHFASACTRTSSPTSMRGIVFRSTR